jgi:hypothetical protein
MRNWVNTMKEIILFLLLLPLLLLAYSDSDFDGISDEHDLCPNSTMMDIVDMKGCTVEKLVIPKENQHHFDIIMGANYTKENKSLNESLQADYYYKDFALQLQTANYKEGGVGDTILSLYYNFKPTQKLSFRLGGSAILPTYDSELDNNNMDYRASLSLSYKLDNLSFFGGATLTLVNDDDINSSTYQIEYQNSHNYYIGFGSYFFSKLYSSLLYSSSSSNYREGETIDNLSLYNYYNIDGNWFTNFGYSKGLNSSSSDQIYINIGYYF